jgi:hypothetical protein
MKIIDLNLFPVSLVDDSKGSWKVALLVNGRVCVWLSVIS